MKSQIVRSLTRSIIAITCVFCLAVAGGAPAPIGIAVTNGSFRVDNITVSGNATLFEGATVETRQSSSLDLTSGPRLLLGADSKGRIFGDRLILEKGSGMMENAPQFRIEAGGLSIHPQTSKSLAQVVLAGNTRVQVAALGGPVRVLNSKGLLVAALKPGAALEFDPQDQGELEKFTGCLHIASGHYLITDEVTNVTAQLTGSGLGKENGNRVEVTGVMDSAPASGSGAAQVMEVRALKRLGKGCVEKAAAAGAGRVGTGGTGGASGGRTASRTVTTVAIIGGVAAAAAAVGLAASGTLSSGSGSSISR